MRGLVCLAAVAALGAGLGLGAKSPSNDWPQFRGANRDGVSQETGLAGSWPDGGPEEVWRVPLGDGYSGISVVGDRLYTMFADDDDEGTSTEFAVAFDVAGPKELWRTPIGEKYVTTFGDGPRSTPAVDGDVVFVLGSYGHLVALSTKDGSEKWRIDLTETFGSEVPTFGFSTSVLVDGDQLVVEGGGKEGQSYAGLDKSTGEVRWTSGDGPDGPTYNSPISVTMGGQTRYVYVVGDKLRSIDTEGNEIWSHPWPSPGETHATPIFIAPNRIFASGAEGVGASVVEVTETKGKAEVQEVWKINLMRNHFSSSVLHDGSIFGFDNATLRSISAETGETQWVKRGLGKGSLIAADGHLIVLSDKGKLVLVEAIAGEYNEQGSVQALEGRCWTAPTLSGGRLYLRNHEEMVSYDLSR